ncbi:MULTISPECIES: hypothetical protein [unclassified Snodgrassella]|uniref:hypothetical protein n=1 Tax=unclassified Snodgrassella TaxID=2625236 RepID=UPI0018DBC3F9|nr:MULTISPECIES: hypothetical protein [unclassified Snodgrassella]MBI0098472.1 chemotaxis protein [Snodgrassella sp. W8134]MBI0102351.1 chemotaxis protein [Snodgrassella sp. W8135]
MPIPLLIFGAAAVATAFGGKKAYDGHKTKQEANEIQMKAIEKYNNRKEQFDKIQQNTNEALNNLDVLELSIGQSIGEFEKLAKELLVKLEKSGYKNQKLSIPSNQLKKISDLSISTTGFLATAAAAGATGAAASFAVYSGVMAFAAASTGTPIAALSGAAAYNATMAAIGGGSLAAGGWGMAGGAMVLGVAAAPILTVAGWAYAIHAEKALANAEEQNNKVNEALEKMNLAEVRLNKITNYIQRINLSLTSINNTFIEYFDALKAMHQTIMKRHQGEDISIDESKECLQKIDNGYALAAIMTEIITTPIFKSQVDEDGKAVIEDGQVQFVTDEDGGSVLNKTILDSVLSEQSKKYDEILSK